jgi:hypothetical protein
MLNNPVIHPRTGNFVEDTLELLSDYLSNYSENEQPPMVLCFRDVSETSRRISDINLIENSRIFSYTGNKCLKGIIFRKDHYLFSYKKNSLIRASFEDSIRSASLTKHPLKDIGATANLNEVSHLKGVQS